MHCKYSIIGSAEGFSFLILKKHLVVHPEGFGAVLMRTVGCSVSVQVVGLSILWTWSLSLSSTAFLLVCLCGLRGRKPFPEFPKGTNQVLQKINWSALTVSSALSPWLLVPMFRFPRTQAGLLTHPSDTGEEIQGICQICFPGDKKLQTDAYVHTCCVTQIFAIDFSTR